MSCPPWVDVMRRMDLTENYDPTNAGDKFSDAVGTLPHDRRILFWPEGGFIIQNDVSV